MINHLIKISFLILFLGPFVFLLSLFKLNFDISMSEILWAVENSFLQAGLSAVFSVLIGIFCAFGLFKIRNKFIKSLIEVLCLAPNFIPPLFSLISVLSFLDPFPIGIPGIVIVHTMINFGLVTILVGQLIESKLGPISESALVMGVGKWSFLKNIFFPLLKKDLFAIGFFIFSVCFASFSIPLVVGGGRGTTLEVLIYEKIRISSEWGGALLMSLLQSLILWSFSFFAKADSIYFEKRNSNLKLIESYFGLILLICLLAAYFMGYGQAVFEAVAKWKFLIEIWDSFWKSILGSWALGVFVGLLTLLLLMALLWLNSRSWFDRFFAGYWAPSTALAGFAFLILGPNEGYYSFFKVGLAFVVLNLNSIYRMGWQKNIQSLQRQKNIAQTIKTRRQLIFFKIEIPQLFKKACFFSGLMAMWMVGDFGLSRILAYKDFTLSLIASTYLSSYRLNEATLLSVFVLFVGIIVFFLFWSLSYVFDRKFKL